MAFLKKCSEGKKRRKKGEKKEKNLANKYVFKRTYMNTKKS